jgi:hypothetical protein
MPFQMQFSSVPHSRLRFLPVTVEKTLVFITETANGDLLRNDCDAALCFDDLSRDALARLGATAVVCLLFGGQLDAMMVLRRLAAIGYSGRCLVLCPKLPRRDLVLKELQAEAPGILIDLIEIEQDPGLS